MSRKKTNVTAPKTIAAATVASLLVGSQGMAATENILLPGSDELPDVSPGEKYTPFGGFFGTMEDVHSQNAVIPSEATDEVLTIEINQDSSESVTSMEDTSELLSDEAVNEQPSEVDTQKLLFADVNSYLNIRSEPSLSGSLVGRLRPLDGATILSYENGWYKISSGEVTGYVSEEYSIVGEDATDKYDELSTPYAKCTTSKLNIRADASLDSEVKTMVSYNDTLTIDNDAELVDGWVGVIVDGEKGYVSEDYIDINDGKLGAAISMEELHSIGTIYNAPFSANVDEVTLMAALLQCEASSYEGMLAVGGVVMNRLHHGYSDSIRGVIYQRGQFAPAGSGKVDRTLAGGSVRPEALDAARVALSGVDITGGCLNFRAAFTGHYGTNIGGNVFF